MAFNCLWASRGDPNRFSFFLRLFFPYFFQARFPSLKTFYIVKPEWLVTFSFDLCNFLEAFIQCQAQVLKDPLSRSFSFVGIKILFPFVLNFFILFREIRTLRNLITRKKNRRANNNCFLFIKLPQKVLKKKKTQ